MKKNLMLAAIVTSLGVIALSSANHAHVADSALSINGVGARASVAAELALSAGSLSNASASATVGTSNPGEASRA